MTGSRADAARLLRATRTAGQGADIRATRHAGLARLEPLNMEAEAWLHAHAGDTWDEGALLLEERFFADIAEGAITAGLTFERDEG